MNNLSVEEMECLLGLCEIGKQDTLGSMSSGYSPLHKKLDTIAKKLKQMIAEPESTNKLIGFQPSTDCFPVAGLESFEVYENLQMGINCHPEVKSWTPIFENTIEKPVIIPYVAPEEDTNKHVQILSHDISYFLRETELDIDDSGQEHIAYMISQDCCEGDLNITDPENPDITYYGYWHINKR